jgi:hypothetical protein
MRKEDRRVFGAAGTVIALAGLLLFAGPSTEAQESQDPNRLQGQVPLKDQLSGRALQGYKQHVELVGHNNILNRLQNGNLGWLDDCAYVSAYFGTSDPTAGPTSGLAVLDVASPRNPRLVQILPATPGARESQVEANEDSRMVVVMPFPRATIFGDPASDASLLQIYDVPGRCTELVRRGTYNFGKENGQTIVTHEHRIWRDKIYAVVTGVTEPGPSVTVVNASNRDNPVLLTTWDLSDEPGMPVSAVHDLDISPDGTRAYLNIRTPRLGGGVDSGLAILDTSEVANWRPGMPRPTIRRISRIVYWAPPVPGGSHSAQWVKIRGRTYVVVMNESSGCPGGWAQIVDVNDEMNPIPISTFRLEVNRPENCERTLPDHDGIPTTGALGILIGTRYGSHYLGVDNPEEPKLVAFTWYSAGLRLVDISDPYSPKEVGYFITPAIDTGGPRAIPDRAYSFVRFHEGNIWFNSVNGGFWVVRFTGEHEDRDRDDD